MNLRIFLSTLLALSLTLPALAQAAETKKKKGTGTRDNATATTGGTANGLGTPHPWLKLDLGASFANLRAFRGDSPRLRGSTVGGLVGADAAIRWERFSIGVRGRVQPMIDFTLWQIAPFVGFHIPRERFDFSATAHIGYSAATFDNNASAQGVFTGAVVAVDYRVAGPLLVGVGVGSDLLLLNPSANACLDGARECSRANIGLGATAAMRFGLLF